MQRAPEYAERSWGHLWRSHHVSIDKASARLVVQGHLDVARGLVV